uniref:Protein AATF n=1 Tax=Parastrongyloides trichosuri TaxID=131310 RepID=A0A0N4ZNF2_PARTI
MGLLEDFEKALSSKRNLNQIIEDEDYDGTSASLLKKPDSNYDNVEEETCNKARKLKDFTMLDEIDEKYKGFKISRKDMFGDECEPTFNDREMSVGEEEVSDEEEISNNEVLNDDEEEDNVSDMDVTLMNTDNNSKSEAVKQQMIIWDKLMRVTIKAHGAMRAFNQLPRGQSFVNLANQNKAKDNVVKARKNILEALQLLVNVEGKFVSHLVKKEDSDDEEIASSEDDDNESNVEEEDEQYEEEIEEEKFPEEEEEEVNTLKIKGGKKFNTYEICHKFNERNKQFESFRLSTLKKWDDKTRLVLLKPGHDFSKFDNNINKQINKIMADKARLLRRSQTKRDDCTRIGDTSDGNFDVEIFDDSDFYQVLLKDLIERKTVDVNDPIQMSKQWLDLQKLRQTKKKKKNVNQKASKGRKCTFVTIPKLVNFYPAEPELISWGNEKRTELFKSLFAS